MTRLAVLDHGHSRRARIAMRLIPLVAGTDLDDVGKTSLYRPKLFGRLWLALLREVMIGPSDWTRGERELLAAFVWNRNRCPYCVGIHTGTATIGLHREAGPELLDHWQGADFGPRLEAAFTLLAAVRDDPDHGAAGAAAAAGAAGLSDSANATPMPTHSATRSVTKPGGRRRPAPSTALRIGSRASCSVDGCG